jgi:hypothetical protein
MADVLKLNIYSVQSDASPERVTDCKELVLKYDYSPKDFSQMLSCRNFPVTL